MINLQLGVSFFCQLRLRKASVAQSRLNLQFQVNTNHIQIYLKSVVFLFHFASSSMDIKTHTGLLYFTQGLTTFMLAEFYRVF